jgi:hypothetical protein
MSLVTISLGRKPLCSQCHVEAEIHLRPFGTNQVVDSISCKECGFCVLGSRAVGEGIVKEHNKKYERGWLKSILKSQQTWLTIGGVRLSDEDIQERIDALDEKYAWGFYLPGR